MNYEENVGLIIFIVIMMNLFIELFGVKILINFYYIKSKNPIKKYFSKYDWYIHNKKEKLKKGNKKW